MSIEHSNFSDQTPDSAYEPDPNHPARQLAELADQNLNALGIGPESGKLLVVGGATFNRSGDGEITIGYGEGKLELLLTVNQTEPEENYTGVVFDMRKKPYGYKKIQPEQLRPYAAYLLSCMEY